MSVSFNNASLIKQEAKRLGFYSCGITSTESLAEDEIRFNHWLDSGLNGNMQFFKKHKSKRISPAELINNARSIICVSHNYYPGKIEVSADIPRISKYALGRDYHIVLKKKLYSLLDFINKNIKPVHGKVFVDSGPLFEKALAARAGLGWIGKNTLLLNREIGSYVFLGELVIDLELDYDIRVSDYCGSCNLCTEACPTKALIGPGKLDARRCISYLTVESKDDISLEFKGKLQNNLFGCDICQDVCPWNNKAVQSDEFNFERRDEMLKLLKNGDWKMLTEINFKSIFNKTPLSRIGYSRIKKNLEFIK